jgi:hypothetical protein
MKSASVSEIKKELKHLPQEALLELCIKVAKYKVENKELLSYLLFDAHDEASYINTLKLEMDQMFTEVNKTNVYLAKKTIRKVLRHAQKHIKYSGSKQTEVELLIYFCKGFKRTRIAINKYLVLSNMYEAQLKKVTKALSTLHEDLQIDYENDFEEIKGF